MGGGWGGSSSHTGEAVPSCAASTRVWSLCCFAVAARGIEDRATVRALRFCPRPSVDKDCEADAGHHRHERKDTPDGRRLAGCRKMLQALKQNLPRVLSADTLLSARGFA